LRGRRGAKPLVAVVAGALLLGALAPLAVRYFHDSAWRVSGRDRPFVDRALTAAAMQFRTSAAEYRLITRPSVRRGADQICVELTTAHHNGDGSYFTCYDYAGRVILEKVLGPSFGPSRISDRLRALVW
jgi:hypothetical protein